MTIDNRQYVCRYPTDQKGKYICLRNINLEFFLTGH